MPIYTDTDTIRAIRRLRPTMGASKQLTAITAPEVASSGEFFSAVFRATWMDDIKGLASIFTARKPIDYDYNVVGDIPEDMAPFSEEYSDSSNKEETDFITARLRQQMEDNLDIESWGWTGTPIHLAAEFTSPVWLAAFYALPVKMFASAGVEAKRFVVFADMMKTYKAARAGETIVAGAQVEKLFEEAKGIGEILSSIGAKEPIKYGWMKGFAEGAARMGFASAVDEAVVQQAPNLETFGDSLRNIAVQSVFGGLLHAGIGRYNVKNVEVFRKKALAEFDAYEKDLKGFKDYVMGEFYKSPAGFQRWEGTRWTPADEYPQPFKKLGGTDIYGKPVGQTLEGKIGPAVDDFAAEATNFKDKIYEAISKGEVTGKQAKELFKHHGIKDYDKSKLRKPKPGKPVTVKDIDAVMKDSFHALTPQEFQDISLGMEFDGVTRPLAYYRGLIDDLVADPSNTMFRTPGGEIQRPFFVTPEGTASETMPPVPTQYPASPPKGEGPFRHVRLSDGTEIFGAKGQTYPEIIKSLEHIGVDLDEIESPLKKVIKQVAPKPVITKVPEAPKAPAKKPAITSISTLNEVNDAYPTAPNKVDGRIVRSEIPNQSSIYSTIDNPEILSGVRVVPMSEFQLTGRHYSSEGSKRIKELAEEIKETNEINPLIVVVDEEGPYILEGATRAEALFRLGATSFPAQVVIDNDVSNIPSENPVTKAPEVVPAEPSKELIKNIENEIEKTKSLMEEFDESAKKKMDKLKPAREQLRPAQMQRVKDLRAFEFKIDNMKEAKRELEFGNRFLAKTLLDRIGMKHDIKIEPGETVTAYRGSRGDYEAISTHPYYVGATWFTDTFKGAHSYAGEEGGKVTTAELNIHKIFDQANPKHLDQVMPEVRQAFKNLQKQGHVTSQEFETLLERIRLGKHYLLTQEPNVIKKLRELGFDSILNREIGWDIGVLSKENIKVTKQSTKDTGRAEPKAK